jgi:hypothetical protein
VLLPSPPKSTWDLGKVRVVPLTETTTFVPDEENAIVSGPFVAWTMSSPSSFKSMPSALEAVRKRATRNCPVDPASVCAPTTTTRPEPSTARPNP